VTTCLMPLPPPHHSCFLNQLIYYNNTWGALQQHSFNMMSVYISGSSQVMNNY
jgi:hypothetical protein